MSKINNRNDLSPLLMRCYRHAVGLSKNEILMVSGALALTIGAGLYLFGDRNEEIEDPVKVIKTKHGKEIRIVTTHKIDGNVEETEFGSKKVIQQQVDDSVSIPSDAICNIVFQAKIKKQGGRFTPDVKDIELYCNAGVFPVLIDWNGDDGIWNVLGKGADCVELAKRTDYIGSEMHQFIKHPKKTAFLKIRAKPGVMDNFGYPKTVVNVGDKDADLEAPVWVPHVWAGRDDVNFSYFQKDVIIPVKEQKEKENKQ